ncbi:MAG: RNA polymerase Rpb4 family protein [Infirmifilum sp.]
MPKILGEKSLTIAELRETLETIEKSRELSGIERYTLEYARKFAKIQDPARARAIVERLMKEFDLPEDTAVQLVNVKPQDPAEVRLILLPLNKVFSDEDYRKIIDVVSSE